MIKHLATLGICLLSGCVTTSPEASVTTLEVRQNIQTWNGRVVTIVGWLGNCRGVDCGIYASLDDARAVGGGANYTEATWRAAMDRRLSIGFDRNFDRQAKPLQFKKVRLKGRISSECSGDNICLDRAPDIYPISIHPA